MTAYTYESDALSATGGTSFDLPDLAQYTKKPLMQYIEDRSTVVIIDDDKAVIQSAVPLVTSQQLTPTELDGMAVGMTYAATCAAETISLEACHLFDQVFSVCRDRLGKRAGRYPIFVTDINLKLNAGGALKKTGLDLIERLRNDPDVGPRAGLVAYTQYSSPWITMSAYHRGADFVVVKHQHSTKGGHDIFSHSGDATLQLTVAYLTFQKTTLRSVRERCKKLLVAPDPRAARRLRMELDRVLPTHTVSIHARGELADTAYVLDSMWTSARSEDVRVIQSLLEELGRRYD